jgi:glycosyltransferase involved in cell wall biosynthesis
VSEPLALLLDLHGLQSYDHGERGIGRYIAEQSRQLLRSDGDVSRLLLHPGLPFPGHAPPGVLSSPALAWNTATTLRSALADGARAYHVMSPFEMHSELQDLLPPLVAAARLPLVATLYDLIPLLHPDRYLPDAATRQRYRQRLSLLQRADLVLAISERTRLDGIAHAGLDPARVVTVGAGVAPFFSEAADISADRLRLLARWPELHGGFVLSVSGADSRKQTVELIHAFARVPWTERAPHPLVVVGSLPEAMQRQWLGIAAVAGLRRGELLFTGHIDDSLLRSLYRCATLFIFPSLYEGFGLPVAEAMACGCPALTANTSSLPELLEWDEATFDPGDIGAMAAALRRALCDPGFRVALRRRGRERASAFTWEAVARRTREAVGTLLSGERPAARLDPQLRVAVVPTSTGAVAAADRLIAAFAGQGTVQRGTEHVDSAAGYDAVVYVDTGAASVAARQSAHQHPGIVWLAESADLGRAAAFWGRDARALVVGSDDDARRLRFAAGPQRWLPPVFVAAPDDAAQLVRAVQATTR